MSEHPRKRVSTSQMRAINLDRDVALQKLRETRERVEAGLAIRKSKNTELLDPDVTERLPVPPDSAVRA